MRQACPSGVVTVSVLGRRPVWYRRHRLHQVHRLGHQSRRTSLGRMVVDRSDGRQRQAPLRGWPGRQHRQLEAAEASPKWLEEYPKVELVEPISQAMAVTNWDPAETQQADHRDPGQAPGNQRPDQRLRASCEAAFQAFQAGRPEIPPIATEESNALACTWKEERKREEFPLMTIISRTGWAVTRPSSRSPKPPAATPPALERRSASDGVRELGRRAKNPVSATKNSRAGSVFFSNLSEEEMRLLK